MDFTREPIIETVITPREGCKLVVRSSKGASQEDYFVDAVEVVSFGHSFFFRSLERPKSFLVPVSDYEILELKETRMVLKSANSERSIKIGGGREAPMRREPEREEGPSASSSEPMSERKRDNKRRRGRRGRDRDRAPEPALPADYAPEALEGSEMAPEPSPAPERPAFPEEVKAPSFISKLFPPPPVLIKETLSRYKPTENPEGDNSDESLHFEEKGDLDLPPLPDDLGDEQEE